MLVRTSRFGEINIDESSIIKIPRGMLGFERFTRFCIIEHRVDSPLKWLQSIDQGDLAFIVTDPSQFFQDYEVEVSDPDVEFLEIQSPNEAVVMSLVTINKDNEVTTNLLGPIVVNARTLVGLQVVLQNDNYGTKHNIGLLDGCETREEQPLTKVA